ncbi:hypothetical protein FRC03_003093 [Tulasnella sp. 419]|nr:hypothetical protein FRC02_004041 [Tulasnella sp. 418]KAG8969402.1 hypothetical protein FRC03_003093 [Tulasnella sp. 419]
MAPLHPRPPPASMSRIREVWANNLDQEIAALRDTMDQYNYIAMDTEFPGTVARPIGSFKTSSDYQFQTMRCNVELLKVIQIGLTLCDADGNFAPEPCTWQFNFRFSLNEDMYAPDSIDMLRQANIDFARHEEFGIEPNDFAELMITSGLVLSDDTKWVSYASQNDFGYLLKVLTAAPLPAVESEFHDLLKIWFPNLYDIKYIVRSLKPNTKGGLQDLAEELQVVRHGPAHQAGSDALLTAGTFFKVREILFPNEPLDNSRFSGHIYGISGDANFMPTTSGNSASPVVPQHNAPLHTPGIYPGAPNMSAYIYGR